MAPKKRSAPAKEQTKGKAAKRKADEEIEAVEKPIREVRARKAPVEPEPLKAVSHPSHGKVCILFCVEKQRGKTIVKFDCRYYV